MRSTVNRLVVGVILALAPAILQIEPVDESAQGGTRREVKRENQLFEAESVVFKVPVSWEYSAALVAPEKRRNNPNRGQASRLGESGKPRVIVLTDIGGDPDDQQSMVRFLVYANEFDVEGLIATTSGWKSEAVHPEAIRERSRSRDPRKRRASSSISAGSRIFSVAPNPRRTWPTPS